MKSFTLHCRGDGFKKAPWRVEPIKDGVQLVDPDGQVPYWVRHSKAENAFLLPSFWQSIKYIGFVVDEKKTIWFDPKPEAVAAVRSYLEEVVMSEGMPGVLRLRKKGWLNFLIGCGLLVICFVRVGVAKTVLNENHHARTALGGVLLGSIAETAYGLSILVRAWRLSRKLGQRKASLPD